MRRYFEEAMDFNSDGIKNDVLFYNALSKEDLITIIIEEKNYIFTDEDEHSWNVECVKNIINDKPVLNRWEDGSNE